MMPELLRKIVPAQRQGAKTGGSARVRCHSATSARELFRTASRRLLCINDWGRYAGKRVE